VLKQLFTGLTRINQDLEPEPAVAESWEFNEDNTQIIFTLRESTWSDGLRDALDPRDR
jgi:ABC-type oligopeptide transport system substrate-binding subunit